LNRLARRANWMIALGGLILAGALSYAAVATSKNDPFYSCDIARIAIGRSGDLISSSFSWFPLGLRCDYSSRDSGDNFAAYSDMGTVPSVGAVVLIAAGVVIRFKQD